MQTGSCGVFLSAGNSSQRKGRERRIAEEIRRGGSRGREMSYFKDVSAHLWHVKQEWNKKLGCFCWTFLGASLVGFPRLQTVVWACLGTPPPRSLSCKNGLVAGPALKSQRFKGPKRNPAVTISQHWRPQNCGLHIHSLSSRPCCQKITWAVCVLLIVFLSSWKGYLVHSRCSINIHWKRRNLMAHGALSLLAFLPLGRDLILTHSPLIAGFTE